MIPLAKKASSLCLKELTKRPGGFFLQPIAKGEDSLGVTDHSKQLHTFF